MRRLSAVAAGCAALVVVGGMLSGVAHADTNGPMGPECQALFQLLEHHLDQLDRQQAKIDRTKQNIVTLGKLIASAQSSQSSSFFNSQLVGQFSTLQAQEGAKQSIEVQIAQDEAELAQSGCSQT